MPNTAPHAIPNLSTRSVYDRALQAITFMHRYHPSTDVPSRVLATAMMDDEQQCLQQAERGDGLVGQSMAFVQDSDTCLLLCAGGTDRCDVLLSRLVMGERCSAHSGHVVLHTKAPIVQLRAERFGESISVLVRTLTSVLYGTLVNGHINVHHALETGHNFKTQLKDAQFASLHEAYVIDAHGTVRLWDACGRTTAKLASLESAVEDRWWILASQTPVMYAASCYDVHAIDLRTKTPSALLTTSHSVESLRRSMFTSLHVSALPHMLVTSSTDSVQYHDTRMAREPWHTWTHHRGFDRSLAMSAVHVGGTEYILLSSQRNRLHTVYATGPELTFDAPGMLPSAAPHTDTTSPTPPLYQTIEDVVVQTEQTDRGAVWMQLFTTSDKKIELEAFSTLQSPAANATQDAGPFGSMEVTHMDFRAVYKRTSSLLTQSQCSVGLAWITLLCGKSQRRSVLHH